MYTFLRINLHPDVEVDAHDDEIAEDIECAHSHEDVGIIEGDLFRDLHHPQDDDQVGSA